MFDVRKEAHSVVEKYIDTMVFYLNEYGEGNQTKMEDIANTFCEEYRKLFFELISEIVSEMEEEE